MLALHIFVNHGYVSYEHFHNIYQNEVQARLLVHVYELQEEEEWMVLLLQLGETIVKQQTVLSSCFVRRGYVTRLWDIFQPCLWR